MVNLLYHDVVPPGEPRTSGFPGADADSYKLEAPLFRRHVEALGAALGHGTAGIRWTFDDGGASALTHIAPMLEAAGCIGWFFIPTDYIGRSGFLDADGIRELRRRGHVVGSHSATHPLRMGACPWEQLLDEWTRSVATLSDILGEPVDVASVPGGYYTRRVGRAAAQAGIRTLFTSEPSPAEWTVDGCRVHGRFSLRAGDPPELAVALATGRGLARRRQWLGWNGRKVAKVIAGPLYLRVRRALWR